MTQEEKAKRYDEALERARKLQENSILKKWLWNIFPELKESEDEKIRKAILAFIRQSSEVLDKQNQNNMIAWLEKQGEQKPYGQRKECSDCQFNYVSECKGSCQMKKGEQKSADSYCQENCKGFQETGKCFADGDCKAKREAESVDKFEPKFHEGDWIVQGYNILKIKCVGNTHYCFETVGGYVDDMLISEIDSQFHLWTIQDAKDGDVLVTDEMIVLFKKRLENDSILTYFHYDTIDDEYEPGAHLYYAHIYPATKEQRDTLERAMADAGYAFDFEKKELKKIENEIEIPFGAKDSELQEVTYYIPKGFHAEIDDDKVVIKKGEKPTAWTEEDNMMIEETLYFLREYQHSNRCKDESDMQNSVTCREWLKSLKERIGG